MKTIEFDCKMKKNHVLSISAILIIVIVVSVLIVSNQLSNLHAQISELQSRNQELEHQVMYFQNQTQIMEDRIIELLERFSDYYSSPVKIVEFNGISGWTPIAGLLIAHYANVVIKNDRTNEVKGLTLTAKIVNMYDDHTIGPRPQTMIIDSLLPGETREVNTLVFSILGGGESWGDGVIVLTLKQDGTVIDEWIRTIEWVHTID